MEIFHRLVARKSFESRCTLKTEREKKKVVLTLSSAFPPGSRTFLPPPDARTERVTNYEARCNQGGPWQAEPGSDEPACHRRAPGLRKLINHQGGARGVHSLQPSISTPGGEAITSPFPCAAISHPSPPPFTSAAVFDSQISRSRYWLARHSMVWKVAGGCNQIKCDKRDKGAFRPCIRVYFFFPKERQTKKERKLWNRLGTRGAKMEMRLDCFSKRHLVTSPWLASQIEM